MTTRTAECPECGASVAVPANVQLSEILSCPDCQAELEVTGIDGAQVTLSLAPEEDEDWGE